MAESIETSIDAAIEAGRINGAVICATDAEGHFIYDKAFGARTLLSGVKVPQRLDDVLFLASGTKLITTIAAMKLVEQGLLSLTGDLSSVAPDLAAKQVITGFSDDGETPLLEPAKQPITLEMLLTHTSGTAYSFLNPLLTNWSQKFDPPGDSPRPVEEAFPYPLAFHPGTSWMYSVGLDWAGKVIERVTGRTLGENVKQSICDPLGITDAQFYPVTREDLRSRLVDLNPQDPHAYGRAVVGGNGDLNRRAQGDFGGHGLFMPAADYIKILHSLLANDGKLLKPTTVKDMFQNHLSQETSPGYQAARAGPMGQFFRVGIDVETKTGHGLGGVVTLEDVEGWYGEGTMTWGGGLSLAWFIDRKNDLCGVCALQPTLPDVDGEILETLKQNFRRDIYHKHAAWKEQQQTVCD
ncbi:MAG: hypothetical protein Q9172_002032 [Xanthocarpia lactea]